VIYTIRFRIFRLPISYLKIIKIKICRTVILAVVLYGCAIWFLVKRLLRRTFGRKRDDVIGEWRKLHNELRDLYSPDITKIVASRRMRWMGYVALFVWVQSFGRKA
jgi:hypothetical protein